MSNQIDYAEMIEIPVNTLNVVQKKSKKKKNIEDLKQQTIDAINDRVEFSPNIEESEALEEGRVTKSGKVYEKEGFLKKLKFFKNKRTKAITEGEQIKKSGSKVLLAEFICVCVLSAVILLTNLFMENSAINSYARNIFFPEEVVFDTRSYLDFDCQPIVSANAQNMLFEVADDGVISFEGESSIYSPCEGKVKSFTQDEFGYNVEVEHSSLFTTIFSGLKYLYNQVGDKVYPNVPIGFTEGGLSVCMYENNEKVTSFAVSSDYNIVWQV